jgi:hypothetical protein
MQNRERISVRVGLPGPVAPVSAVKPIRRNDI